MIVEATYVLCTSASRTIDEKEARHKDKVKNLKFFLILNFRMKFVFNAITVLPHLKLK
jgi:hypothetical protein